jgi:hypothetical protein
MVAYHDRRKIIENLSYIYILVALRMYLMVIYLPLVDFVSAFGARLVSSTDCHVDDSTSLNIMKDR